MPTHRSAAELEANLADIRQSPLDGGVLEAIVVRPAVDQRTPLTECDVSPRLGVHGDCWSLGCWMSLSDGSPHPDVQVALMNARAIRAIAGSKDFWPLAGDNLFVDLDLGRESLPVGQAFAIGTAMFEVTEIAHNGCKKFAQRFGEDAVRWVNSKTGKQLRLRGVYARVVRAGAVRVGDAVRKLPPERS